MEFMASATETCSVMYAASAREAEDMMSGQWGWWVHSSGIEVGDPAFTYGPNVEVREGPDQGSPVTLVVEANATPLVILEKGERTDLDEMGGSWFRVQVGATEGWIWGAFVHPDPLSEQDIG
jgi:hypothetical protein